MRASSCTTWHVNRIKWNFGFSAPLLFQIITSFELIVVSNSLRFLYFIMASFLSLKIFNWFWSWVGKLCMILCIVNCPQNNSTLTNCQINQKLKYYAKIKWMHEKQFSSAHFDTSFVAMQCSLAELWVIEWRKVDFQKLQTKSISMNLSNSGRRIYAICQTAEDNFLISPYKSRKYDGCGWLSSGSSQDNNQIIAIQKQKKNPKKNQETSIPTYLIILSINFIHWYCTLSVDFCTRRLSVCTLSLRTKDTRKISP